MNSHSHPFAALILSDAWEAVGKNLNLATTYGELAYVDITGADALGRPGFPFETEEARATSAADFARKAARHAAAVLESLENISERRGESLPATEFEDVILGQGRR